jgi:hypothetical protein
MVSKEKVIQSGVKIMWVKLHDDLMLNIDKLVSFEKHNSFTSYYLYYTTDNCDSIREIAYEEDKKKRDKDYGKLCNAIKSKHEH